MKLEQKKYSITFETTGSYSIEIEAESPERAVEIASEAGFQDVSQEERDPEESIAVTIHDTDTWEEVWSCARGSLHWRYCCSCSQDEMESECIILSYESEDYKLVPKTNCKGHQETDAEYEKRVEELDGKPCNCGSEVKE